MSHACWSNLSETATTTWIWFPFRHSFGRLPYDHNRITNIIVIINPFFYTDKHLVHCIDVKMGFPALWRWLKHGCTYIVSIKNDDALSFYMLQEKTVFLLLSIHEDTRVLTHLTVTMAARGSSCCCPWQLESPEGPLGALLLLTAPVIKVKASLSEMSVIMSSFIFITMLTFKR